MPCGQCPSRDAQPSWTRHSLLQCGQGIDAAFIKQPLPGVHGLPCYAHDKGYFGAAFADLQHSRRSQSPFTASLNRFCTMTIFSSIDSGDITFEILNGCHVFRKYQ